MFSIIIPIGPARNGLHALCSLVSAGLDEGDQVIVVGDGHQPEVNAFSDKLPIRIASTPEISGANAARNLGAGLADQPYICFLDDDDEYLPNAIETLHSLIAARPDVVVWSLSWEMASKRSMPRARRKEKLSEIDICRQNVAGGCSSMVVKAGAFQEVGGFDPKMKSMQDWDLWLRLSVNQSITLTQEPLILYRDHDQARISTNTAARTAGLERLYSKHFKNWSNSVRAFHQARLAAERYKSKEGSWFSIFKWQAPLASLAFALRAIGYSQ
ncbi:MAG: glycosyltransferase family A protein [Opitutaceae bacterium]